MACNTKAYRRASLDDRPIIDTTGSSTA
jgi:hypothetical protein